MKIYAYLRISTGKQDEAGQRHKVEMLAQRAGLTVDEWTVETESRGVKWQDRQLAQVLAKMERGDWLYISEVSRIGASIGGIFSLMEKCVEAGISLRCADPEMTLDDSPGAAALAFAFGLASRIERYLIKSRTRSALAALKESGVQLGRPKGKAKIRRLDQFREAIWSMKHNKISDAAIGRTFNAHRITVGSWLRDNPLPGDENVKQA